MNQPNNPRLLAAVAAAALNWNRARLARIEAAKLAKRTPWPAPGWRGAEELLRKARANEAQAKAALRKACAAADPAPLVIDVAAEKPKGLTYHD